MIIINVKMPGKIFDDKKVELFKKVSEAASTALGLSINEIGIVIDDSISYENFSLGGQQCKSFIDTFKQQLQEALEESAKNKVNRDLIIVNEEETTKQKSERLKNEVEGSLISNDTISLDDENVNLDSLKDTLKEMYLKSDVDINTLEEELKRTEETVSQIEKKQTKKNKKFVKRRE